MKWALLAALGAGLARGGDVLRVLDEALTKDEEADEKATKAAKCWCDKFQDTLDSRKSETTSTLTHLEGEHKVRESQNELIRVQLEDHQKEVADLKVQLESSRNMAAKEAKEVKETLKTHKETLKTIQSAIDSLPKNGSSDSVAHTALRGVEQSTKQQVEEAQQQLEDTSSTELVEGKADMLDIATKMHKQKLKQLASGLAASKKLTEQISVFRDQAELDAPLNQHVESLCSELKAAAQRRIGARQSTQVATSRAIGAGFARATADDATAVSLARKRLRRKGASTDPNALYIEAVTESHKALEDLSKRSQEVEQELESMLSGVSTNLNSAGGSDVPAEVKAAAEKLDGEAKATLAKIPELFEAVRSAAAASGNADKKLVDELKEQELAAAAAAAPAAAGF
eukprot:TRINITY_DN106844_c0_g1_i1.p1 TRINITY_DN106844_c0_g1~~TRINITY_DN106844_c0_g1_i1.p1  ORF type:complete len:400 (+),score=133.29 TRINITY_DN106844_c0_g1_i1:41-1240(+)